MNARGKSKRKTYAIEIGEKPEAATVVARDSLQLVEWRQR